MRPETYAFMVVLRLPDGRTQKAEKPWYAHSEWSAGAQYLRANPGAQIATVVRMQQG